MHKDFAKTILLLASLFLASAHTAQATNCNLFGLVVGTDSVGIPGVKVALVSAGLSATTDSTGAYKIVGTFDDVARENPTSVLYRVPAIFGNFLYFSLSKSEHVRISMVDISGRQVFPLIDKQLLNGNWEVGLPRSPLTGKGLIVVSVQIGNENFAFKHLLLQKGVPSASNVPGVSSRPALAKQLQTVDILTASKTGYVTGTVELSSYTGMVPKIVLAQTIAARDKEIMDALTGAGLMNTDLVDTVKQLSPPKDTTYDSASIPKFHCRQTNYSITQVPSQFVALNPNADVLWPGALIQGNSMTNGVLSPILVNRTPGTITLTLNTGGALTTYSKLLPSPSLSSATDSMNKILSTFKDSTPAKFSYQYTSVYSMEQLAVAVGASVKGAGWSGAASLSFNASDHKNRMLIQFSQEFYTMAFQPSAGGPGMFATDVTAAILAPYMGPSNPPVYVASVTYGRIFYLLFESSGSSQDLRAAISGSYSSAALSASANASLAFKKTINECSIKAYGLGGDASAAVAAVTGGSLDTATNKFDMVRKFLVANANFSQKNPGVPISYMLRNVMDLSQVKLALTTSYTANDCSPVLQGCDGVPGSTKTNDSCGVCGGDGSTCKACAAQDITYSTSHSYVTFHVEAAANLAYSTEWSGGEYYHYVFPDCYEIHWPTIKFQCRAGTWYQAEGSAPSGDYLCNPDENTGQVGLTTGNK
jgi:hypothetical protein